MEDKILEMFFEPARWESAISKGVVKGIDKGELYDLTKPVARAAMYVAIKSGAYEIAPPHTAKIPKDNGDFRTVYVNEPMDRVLLSITNDLLFELTPEMVHPRCKSYQKGLGCGKVVKEVSAAICGGGSGVVGWKSDLSKYFDSVPIQFIDAAFDKVELKHGHSALITVLRKYYHSDWYFSPDGKLQKAYQSLKQGCSVASWLADVLLWHIDDRLSRMDGYYVRYSDDMLFVGKAYATAMSALVDELADMGMKLNPKKVEDITADRWFKFLGYSIKGDMLSISPTRLKTFQREIERRTIRQKNNTFQRALNSVNTYLYKGYGGHSWASQILSVCNSSRDIDELNKFVMDCLRAVVTGKRKVGGLGWVRDMADGCVQRGTGRNVSENLAKAGGGIPGYITLGCVRNAMLTSKDAYEVLVRLL